MTNDLRFGWELSGTGWATCRIADGSMEAAQSVLRLHGEDGYLAKWVEHPFPVAALQDLRRLHLQHDGCEREHDVAFP